MTRDFQKRPQLTWFSRVVRVRGPKVLQFGFHLGMCVASSGDGRVVTWGDAESGGAAGLT